MNQSADYSAFEVGPSENAFAALDKLVAEVRATEREVENLGIQMNLAQERLRDLTWHQLPEMMKAMGLTEFKNRAGLCITIKENVEAGISEANRETAHAWLDKNGHSGLLKRDVVVSFNKDQADAAKELVKELQSEGYASISVKQAVHPSTLKAWVREMMREGKDIPIETFGVFVRRVAQINQTK